MNNISRTETPKTWRIYTAIWVFSKNEQGQGVKNYLRLEGHTGTYPDFSSAYSRMERIGQDIMARNQGHISTMSRSADYCTDTWVAKADNSLPAVDCYCESICFIEVIATTETLTLKEI